MRAKTMHRIGIGTLLWWATLGLLLLEPGVTRPLSGAPLPDYPGSQEDQPLRGGLANCRAKFLAERTGVVGYVGGSITFAQGWSQLVDRELQQRFPDTKFVFVHAGISSIDSTGHAFRLQQDLLEKGLPDLVFVEAAVNDLHNHRTEVERRRAMEGIVRQLRRANRFVDIVFLHFAEPRHTADYEQGRIPSVIASHEAVAEHYDLPAVNLAREVQRRLAAKQFDWSRDFKGLHPAPFGHELYFQSIRRLFDRAWEQPPATQRAERTLPPPLDPACYDAGSLVSLQMATDLRGFRRVESWQPADKAGTRAGFVQVPMLVGEQPGDQFTLRFSGRAVGLLMTAGPDTATLEFRVDGGEWQQRETFTEWSKGLHLPWSLMLAADLKSGPHVLDVRIASRAHPQATGTALRIRQFLVNGLAFDLPPLREIIVPSTLDGTPQPSRLWAPESARSTPTPILVYLHSWSGDYRQDNSAWQREAVRRGWIFLHPNFRGVNRQPQACGSKFARQDVIDALHEVVGQYQVDPERVYLAGSSGGGHMSLLMAGYFPEKFSAVSAWVGISDLAEWYRFHVKDGQPDNYARMTIDSLGGPPPESPGADDAIAQQYRERSPLFHLQRAVGLPLDIAAGVRDGHVGSVPIAHSLRAFNVVARASGAPPVSEQEMQELWEQQKLSQPQPQDTAADETYGRAIVLRRQAGAARVTIFDGGHEGLPAAGSEWLSLQRRRAQLKP